MNHVISKYSAKAYNKLRDWSKVNNKPCVMVKKTGKYATMEFDMWTVKHDLNDEARQKIMELWNRTATKNFESGARKNAQCELGKTSGMVSSIRLNIAVDALPELKEIVFNEENWIPIQLGDRKMRSDGCWNCNWDNVSRRFNTCDSCEVFSNWKCLGSIRSET